jgi:splicing factor 3B subunit 2
MRNAYMEKEEAKKLKQKQRDRMSAKTGKMDIAYEVGGGGVRGLDL